MRRALFRVFLLAACGGCAERSPPPVARNVLLVVVDTLRADRLGCYGHPRPTSPHLDALAARGTLYESCHSQGSWTVPSMISLMSGLYVAAEEERLPEGVPTLAEWMRRSGRTTAAFCGNAVVAEGRGFERGFDHFDGRPDEGEADRIVARFIRWHRDHQQAQDRGTGFFAWLHVTDPHTPYRPRPPAPAFAEDLPASARLRERWQGFAADPVVRLPASALDVKAAGAAMLMEHRLYDGEVRAADLAVGHLLDYLAQAGELPVTLVAVASDHGEALYEHLRYPQDARRWRRQKGGRLDQGVKDLLYTGHGLSFHEEVWRTPLLFAGPGMPAGVRVAGLAANLDVLPTLLAATGMPPPPGAGENLLGGAKPRRDHVFGYSRHTIAVLTRAGLKYIDRRARVTEYVARDRSDADGPPWQLHDLTADPEELIDVAGERPDVLARLARLADDWQQAHRRPTGAALPEAARAALRQLGYLQGE